MAIFISYSHRDADFVDRLAVKLAEQHIHVWLDRLEIRVGDSLIQKIETALQRADAIIVVLSSASVESEWWRRELTGGLVRELEEHKILMLPILIQDCPIPLFLRDKLHADFRLDFERGLAELLRAIAPLANPHRGRIEEPAFLTDYAIDYFDAGEHFFRRLTVVEHAPEMPYIALTELLIEGDDQATSFHKTYRDAGLDWWNDLLIIEALAGSIDEELKVILDDHLPKSLRLHFQDAKLGARYKVDLSTRLLGKDTGNAILIHIGRQLRNVFIDQRRATRALTASEKARVVTIRSQRGDSS
jgi:TIR domain